MKSLKESILDVENNIDSTNREILSSLKDVYDIHNIYLHNEAHTNVKLDNCIKTSALSKDALRMSKLNGDKVGKIFSKPRRDLATSPAVIDNLVYLFKQVPWIGYMGSIYDTVKKYLKAGYYVSYVRPDEDDASKTRIILRSIYIYPPNQSDLENTITLTLALRKK